VPPDFDGGGVPRAVGGGEDHVGGEEGGAAEVGAVVGEGDDVGVAVSGGGRAVDDAGGGEAEGRRRGGRGGEGGLSFLGSSSSSERGVDGFQWGGGRSGFGPMRGSHGRGVGMTKRNDDGSLSTRWEQR